MTDLVNSFSPSKSEQADHADVVHDDASEREVEAEDPAVAENEERRLRLARLAAGIIPTQKIAPELLDNVLPENIEIRVSLEKRILEVMVKEKIAMSCPICCGRSSMPTPVGTYRVEVKSVKSATNSPYGSLIDGAGNLILRGVYSNYDPLPVGAIFVKSPPNVTLKLTDGVVIHSGDANGTASSNGPIVIPTVIARTLARLVREGTKVTIE